MGFPLINYGSVPGTVTTWKAYKESPEENCLLCPSSHSSGWEIWQCESEIDPMSLALAKIGTGKAGPHSSGKGQRISTVRDFRFFLMPWRDKSKSFTCQPASHWSQRVPIFSVWFYITRKNKVCVYTAGGNRPLPSHFLDQCFLCIVANKKNHGWMLFISKWGTVLNSVNSLSILFQVLKQCLSKAFIWETVPNLWTHRSTP